MSTPNDLLNYGTCSIHGLLPDPEIGRCPECSAPERELRRGRVSGQEADEIVEERQRGDGGTLAARRKFLGTAGGLMAGVAATVVGGRFFGRAHGFGTDRTQTVITDAQTEAKDVLANYITIGAAMSRDADFVNSGTTLFKGLVTLESAMNAGGNQIKKYIIWPRGALYYTSIRNGNTFIVHDTGQNRGYFFRQGAITPPGSPSRYYKPSTDTWVNYAPPPTGKDFGEGSCGAYDGTRYIYVALGLGGTDFYRFDTTNTTTLTDTTADRGVGWSAMTAVPVPVGAGATMAYANGKIYLAPGLNAYAWYEYNPTGNSWTAKTSIPGNDPKPGSGVTEGNFPRQGVYVATSATLPDNVHILLTTRHHIERYNASTDTWDSSPWIASRFVLSDGAALTIDSSNNYLYIFQGGGTGQLGRVSFSDSAGTSPAWKFAGPPLDIPVGVAGPRAFFSAASGSDKIHILPGSGTGRLLNIPVADILTEAN